VHQELAEIRKADENTIHIICLTPQGQVVTVSEVWSPTDTEDAWVRLAKKEPRGVEIVSVTDNEFLIGSEEYDAVDDDILLESLEGAVAKAAGA
jgi:hypothetical protein